MRYAYGISGSLPCHPGPTWCQAIAQAQDGSVSKSAKFEGDDADVRANEAIQHHYRHGKWPREMEAQEVEVCEYCGKVLS